MSMVEKIKAVEEAALDVASPEPCSVPNCGTCKFEGLLFAAIAAALAEAEKVDADIKQLRQSLAVVMKPDTARSSEYAAASLRVLLFFERYDPANNSVTEQTTNEKEPK